MTVCVCLWEPLAGWPVDAVAVVGVGLRLPGGVATLDALWVALAEGRDLVGEVPPDRFDGARFADPVRDRPGRSYTTAGGFLPDVAGFDAEYFGISPKEASRMDPQQRLLLECAAEAFDDAGIDPAGLAGGYAAVLIGVSSQDYRDLQQRRLRGMTAYTMGGGAACKAANRLSYAFDLRGPSMAVDTACSSTLTAVHQACEALRSGRSGLALAGGVNVLLGPAGFVGFAQASMLSPTGRCHPFSARADGFVRAEGRFRGYDFLRYARLDLDADLAEQGFTPGSFDLVIAANVLHATRDIAATAGRIAGLLAEGGHLLALEVTNQRVVAPVFGLLESFWTAADPRTRPDGPLLSRDGWTRVLRGHGFAEVVHSGDTEEPARGDYTVLLASRGARSAPAVTARPQAGAIGRHWLVADLDAAGGPLSAGLVARLAGDDPTSEVEAGEDAAAWTAALAGKTGPVDIVLLAGDGERDAVAVTERAVGHCVRLRAVAAACAEVAEVTGTDVTRTDVTLWLVTHTPAEPAAVPPVPGATAATWGATRSLANEIPRLAVRRVALTHPDPAGALDDLTRELTARAADDEVLLTPGGRFATRLCPATTPTQASTDSPDTLGLSGPGLHYQLDWRPTTVPVPRDGEVVIEVRAAGLNYRDIMSATGLVPPPQLPDPRDGLAPLGLECAGTVLVVGPGVRGLAAGDRVAAPAVGCLGSHALTRADRVIPLPERMSYAEGATLPTVFLTVQHSLDHLARLAPGETVLVHGAAGGVGLAAIQYAELVGARVIATAGTPAKRDLLHLLGVEHVLDSRTLHFAEQVRDLTDGEGVDVVLNSLAGEALIRSLRLLKPGGRFIELGKRDIVADNPLPMAAFEANATFFGVDVSPLLSGASRLADRHIAAITDAVRAGHFRPLPHRTYPAARIRDAFACLQHSRHTGKVVVTFDEPVPVQRPGNPVTVDPEATYLVVGGLGGFGAATARYLAARGADLRGRGVTATPYAADATR